METCDSTPQVIARYSALKSSIVIAAGMGLILLLYAPWFWGEGIEYLRRHSQWAILLVIAWIAGIPMFFMLLAALRQLIFKKCTAVWVEGNDIIYLDRRFLRVQKRNVERLESTLFTGFGVKGHMISIYLRNGGVRSIPTTILSESTEVVLAKLKEALGKQRTR